MFLPILSSLKNHPHFLMVIDSYSFLIKQHHHNDYFSCFFGINTWIITTNYPEFHNRNILVESDHLTVLLPMANFFLPFLLISIYKIKIENLDILYLKSSYFDQINIFGGYTSWSCQLAQIEKLFSVDCTDCLKFKDLACTPIVYLWSNYDVLFFSFFGCKNYEFIIGEVIGKPDKTSQKLHGSIVM